MKLNKRHSTMLSKNVQISIEGNFMNDDCTTATMDIDVGISIKICDFIAVDEFSDSDDSKMETLKRSKVRRTISTI